MTQSLSKPLTLARQMLPEDWPGMWEVLEPILRMGTWFTIPSDYTSEQARAFWCADGHQVFVGEREGRIVWTYYICPNQLGGGSHIANAGYAVSVSRFGEGLGGEMLGRSLESARRDGYRAMQFNAVLSSNDRAIHLYEHHGFQTVGRVPDGFLHPKLGYINTLIMYRRL